MVDRRCADDDRAGDGQRDVAGLRVSRTGAGTADGLRARRAGLERGPAEDGAEVRRDFPRAAALGVEAAKSAVSGPDTGRVAAAGDAASAHLGPGLPIDEVGSG